MPNCPGCGAQVGTGEKECPYCGSSIIQKTEAQESTLQSSEGVYRAQIDDEGNMKIQFGDGQTGARPSSGSEVSSHYRSGSGTQGNITSSQLEEKIDRVSRRLERIPEASKERVSEDDGVILLESMAEVSDLLTMYQSRVTDEAHLSTNDRDRISRKEEKVQSKLESIVAFSERMDTKTKKKMKLADSDIHKIRTTAAQVLQMTKTRWGKCARCGAVNRAGARHCQNCGAPL